MVAPKVVTLMEAATVCAAESVIVTVQDPALTDVTVNEPLGPVRLAGETVAMPLHVLD
jgi:hypothetical protein